MMKRFATLLTLAVVSCPSIAFARQSAGPPSKPAEIGAAPRPVTGTPKVEVSAGYLSGNGRERGLYVEAEFGTEGPIGLVAQFGRTARSESYSSPGITTSSESSDVLAMLGGRAKFESARVSVFFLGSAGMRRISSVGTFTSQFGASPVTTHSSHIGTYPAVEAIVGATVKITDRIGLRASGGYASLLSGGFSFIRQLSAGVVMGFGRR